MRRLVLPLLLLILAMAAWFFLPQIGWNGLARHQEGLLAWVSAHPWKARGLFLLAYLLTTALSLPHATLMTVAGGLLFGPVGGCILTILGATAGASILLLILRHAVGGTVLRRRIPPHVRERLARDGFLYLLALRFAPVVPFWVVNLAAAAVGMRLAVFIPATLIGISPASFILSWMGAGIGGLLARGATPDLAVLLAPRFLLPMLALSALSLLPAWLRRRPAAHA